MIRARFARLVAAARAFAADVRRIEEVSRAGGHRFPRLAAFGDTSTIVLALLRSGTALRAVCGSALGTRAILRTVFQIDVWTDAIGPGLRLPHPFGIVIGDGVAIGSDCTILHQVTLQRGATVVGDGVTLTNQVTVLAGATIGDGALVGANSVVRGAIPPRAVAAGTPARLLRLVADR